MEGYFKRLRRQTPTRFWINNPTLAQAALAIEAGAAGCTTNPTYVSKLLASPEDAAEVARAIDGCLLRESDDSAVATKVQAAMVGRLSALFMPLFAASGGAEGFVTVQGDPFTETDAEKIIEEGLENRKIGENVMIKIPVTEPGIEAIDYLVRRDVPTMATEVMGLSQAVSICEAYMAASRASGKSPAFYVTHITGILDDYFKQVVHDQGIALSPEAVKWAGLSIAKRQYALLRERGYPGAMIGGGARKLEDFTELVGGELAVTINWEGSADLLIAKDGPIVPRIEAPVDEALIEELMTKLPDYARALDPEGMRPAEYYDYGGVELFRKAFMQGWRILVESAAKQRREN
jgi:transaldolase